MIFLSPAYLAAFLFGLKISALFCIHWIVNFNIIPYSINSVLELQACSYRLNIGQGQLTALIM